MNTSNPCCAGSSKASAEGAAQDPESIRAQVREGYAKRATQAPGCCGADPASAQHARSIGYSDADLQTVPEESNLGLGCGNPLAYAAPKAGETVLDLGSGAGFDAFLAAAAVGASGRVIGVDMTDEMIAKARANATKSGHANVEFRHGLIEELPVETGTVDVVTSNCVINLSPQKDRVFAEAFRVLRPGGRLVVSDIVLTEPLPEVVRGDLTAYIACLAGASLRDDYLNGVRGAGFVDLEVVQETRVADTMVSTDADDPLVASLAARLDADQLRRLADSVRSVKVFARKPPLSSCGCTAG